MPYRAYSSQNCSIASTLAIIGERWTLLVMREVLLGRRRFAAIREQVGVAPNILSDRLQTLLDNGLLEHRRYGRHPEAMEYVPTEKGRDLAPVLVTLMQWGDRHAISDGAPRVHVHSECEHDAEAQLRCGHCGGLLKSENLRVRPGPGATEQQRQEGVLPASAQSEHGADG